MSKFLIKTTEVYRADTEAEAKQLIEEAKASKEFVLSKYTSEHKSIKSKGEEIDSWKRVCLVKEFTSEKEPDSQVSVNYEVRGNFPSVEVMDDED